MVSVLDVVGLLVLLGVNTLLAALATRFFRDRLKTRWGPMVYTLLLTPVVMLLPVFVISGLLNLGPDLGSSAALVGVTILLPLAVGIAFDYFWMPAPEEVDLPRKYRG